MLRRTLRIGGVSHLFAAASIWTVSGAALDQPIETPNSSPSR